MGIRSDVVCVALKHNVQLSESTTAWLQNTADETLKHEEGILYFFESCKWHTSPHIKRLYHELLGASGDDFIILEACSEYPTTESGANEGYWFDNPWGVYVKLSAKLVFDVDP